MPIEIDHAAVADFWQTYLANLPPEEQPTEPEAWHFCYEPEDAEELAQLVLAGTKTATASLYWLYEHDHEEIPQVGALSIIVNGSGQPVCIIETTEIRILPFNAVDAQFAYDEGEGDRSLAYWREVHWRFFAPECKLAHREPAEDMPVVCERFRRIYP